MTAKQAKQLWLGVLQKYKRRIPKEILIKLNRLRFIRGGEIKKDKYYFYALKHFPSLIRIWEEERRRCYGHKAK